RIVDRRTFEVVQPGMIGLLEVRAPRQMGPDWIRTNDLAEIDTDGFLFIRGRADDAIVRGGFKVSPGEITKVLLQHPAVKDAGVVGLPDTRLGAVPVAAVELRVDATATEAELLAFLRERLVAYQVPTQLKIVPALPRTPSLKVSQPQLREIFQPTPRL
ncbi:MAG: long-chain fatty acid--CoA ligase, partial [Steroidobacteraceae bacterium]